MIVHWIPLRPLLLTYTDTHTHIPSHTKMHFRGIQNHVGCVPNRWPFSPPFFFTGTVCLPQKDLKYQFTAFLDFLLLELLMWPSSSVTMWQCPRVEIWHGYGVHCGSPAGAMWWCVTFLEWPRDKVLGWQSDTFLIWPCDTILGCSCGIGPGWQCDTGLSWLWDTVLG